MSEDMAEGEFCRDELLSRTQSDEDFDQEQKDEILEAFTLYDKDGDGLISTKEIATVMRALGQVPTVCEETDIVAEFAIDQCNEIDFTAFRNLIKKRIRNFDEDYELRESFRRFDKEEKGMIDANWLREMLTTMGEPLTNEEVDAWLDDGEEFIENGHLKCTSTNHESNSSAEEEDKDDLNKVIEEEEEEDTLDDYGLGNKERSYFCAAFTLLDCDGDGIISAETVESIITGLSRESTPENMDEIMTYCTVEAPDGKPGMDFNGFYKYLAKQLIDENDVSQLKNSLEVFDALSPVDGSVMPGLTDLAKLRHHLKHQGMKLTDEEIDYLWEEENNWMLEEKRIETTHLIKKLMDKF